MSITESFDRSAKKGLIQPQAAAALGASIAEISLAENERVHDATILTTYETWLRNGTVQ